MSQIDKPEGILIKSTDTPVGLGVPQAEETKSWIDSQIPYENFAGKDGELDETVVSFVETIVTAFRSRMANAHVRWSDNQKVANGESISAEYEDDVHVPETYKMLQAKAASIEESLFELDPPFTVEGVKDEMSRMKAVIVGAYIRRQMELAGYRNYIRPTVIDAELTGWCAIKVVWDRVLEEIVERNIQQVTKNGKMYLHDERRLKKALVIDGAQLEQVDPFRLIIDLDAGQIKKCAFIGDISDQFVHDLKAKADLGLFSKEQVEKLDNDVSYMSHVDVTDFSEAMRKSRSITNPWSNPQYLDTHSASAKRVRCTEMWCYFDFKDGRNGINHPDGRRITGVQKVVITMAGRTLIQFRLNPFDKKFAPYGIGRLNANGHEMVSVGPFDQVISVNAQFDRYQSSLLRHAELTVDPILITGNDSDLPDSMLGIRPGTIFRHVGDFSQVKIADLPSSASYMHQYFRREHEELSGALRVFEQPQGTATETERKVQEKNRLLRPDIRAIADMWRQVGLIIYWMSGQFATGEQRFQVVGKASKLLNAKFYTISPDMLQEDIDLRFYGADSMQTYAQKGTGIVQWTNLFGALLPNMPSVDLENIALISFEHMVGAEYVDRIFKGKTPEWMLWDQGEENYQLRRGYEVPINDADDHQAHMDEMVKSGLLEMISKKDTPANVVDAVYKHFTRHMQALQAQQAAQQAQMMQAARESELQNMRRSGMAGEGQAAAPGGMEPRPQQGMTNGPTQTRTVAKAGRTGSGTSQSQSMEMQGR